MSLPPGFDPDTTPAGPPPSGVESNFVNPYTAAGAATAVVSIILIFECTFLMVRLYANVRSFQKLAVDDYTAIAATVISWGIAFCALYIRPMARHMWDLPVSFYTTDRQKVEYSERMMLGPAIFLGKASLLLLYRRVFAPSRAFRIQCYIFLVFCFLSQVSFVPINIALCGPGDPEWLTLSPQCTKSYSYGLVQGAANILVDLAIFILPIPMVMNLNLPLKKKLGVLSIFMTGFIAIVASVITMYYRVQIFFALTDINADANYAGYVVLLCGIVETGISVICSSMPAMAAISKHHITHFRFVSSIRARLFTRSASRSEQTEYTMGATKEQGSSRKRPYPRAVGNDSDAYIQLRDQPQFTPSPHYKPTTDVYASTRVADLEAGRIHKTVSMEQSSR